MTRVAVLKGGLSREREVSLVSGASCAVALREAGYDVVEIDVDRQICARLLEVKPDVCFNALHGPLGEDGSIQGLLNILDIPYTHSGVAASSLAMDKVRTKLIADQHGVRSPKGGLIDAETFWASDLSAPYVIKPVNDGSSISTFVMRDPSVAPFERDAWPYRNQALFEEMIEGPELTVTVLDGRSLTVTEIVPTGNQFYDYTAKYAPGGSVHVIPARISPSAFQTCLDNALKIHEALGCRGISRSDFILDVKTDEPVFLEVNTQPGMTPTSLAPEQAGKCGISFPQLMRILIENARTD